MEKTLITRETLKAFGMEETPNNGFHFCKKTLSEPTEENEGEINLVIANYFGAQIPALHLPGGGTLWLGAVSCIEDLRVIEKIITSYEPNY